MKSYMNAVGFYGVNAQSEIEAMMTKVLKDPTKRYVTNHDDNQLFIEYFKNYGERMGIVVRGLLDKEETIDMGEWDPYMDAKYIINVSEVDIEETDEPYFYYGVFEDVDTGTEMIFQIQNVIDYLEAVEEKEVFIEGIKVVGLASEGTIILPVEKTEEDRKFENEEKKWRKELLKRAKEGDEDAQELLEMEDEEAAGMIEQRLQNEDFLSVIEGYMLPCDFFDAAYFILGTIEQIEEMINTETNQKVYWMYIETMGVKVEVAVNEKDLTGTPMVGMRFMGTCWIQGKVVFS
jgi:hypothetical protein